MIYCNVFECGNVDRAGTVADPAVGRVLVSDNVPYNLTSYLHTGHFGFVRNHVVMPADVKICPHPNICTTSDDGIKLFKYIGHCVFNGLFMSEYVIVRVTVGIRLNTEFEIFALGTVMGVVGVVVAPKD